MSKQSSEEECLPLAQKLLKTCQTAHEMRVALSILLPCTHKMSLRETADIIGCSLTATYTMRKNFITHQQTGKTVVKKRRQNEKRLTQLTREAIILDKVMTEIRKKPSISIEAIKPQVEEFLEMKISLSTLYNMLKRQGWKKEYDEVSNTSKSAYSRAKWVKL